MRNIWEENSSYIKEQATSVGIITGKSSIVINGNNVYPKNQKTLGENLKSISGGACKDEKFLNEKFFTGSGSGFLISPTIFATAGHNIPLIYGYKQPKELSDSELKSACSQLVILFNYQNSSGSVDPSNTTSDIFYCKEIHRVSSTQDHALIELDRPAPYKPLIYVEDTKTNEVPVGVDMYAIGHPGGLPKKVSDGQIGINATSSKFNWIFSNTDILAGTSGSPFIHKQFGVVFGVIVEDRYPSAEVALKKQNGVYCNGLVSLKDTEFSVAAVPMSNIVAEEFGPYIESSSTTPRYAVPLVFLGDVTGDGRDDVIISKFSLSSSYPVYVGASPSVPISNQQYELVPPDYSHVYKFWSNVPFIPGGIADADGDGLGDLWGFQNDTFFISKSNGTSFSSNTQIKNNICSQGPCYPADVNGDGKSDVVSFGRDNRVRVAINQGNFSFSSPDIWHNDLNCQTSNCDSYYVGFPGFGSIGYCRVTPSCKLGDVNGDRKADLVKFRSGDGIVSSAAVDVALSNGNYFDSFKIWKNYFCPGKPFITTRPPYCPIQGICIPAFSLEYTPSSCDVKDVSGDKMSDLVYFSKASNQKNFGEVFVSTSSGDPNRGFGQDRLWHGNFCSQGFCSTGDVTGDGAADLVQVLNNFTWVAWAQ